MIRDFTPNGLLQFIAHMVNIRNAINFLVSHEDCVELDDDDYGTLHRMEHLACVLLDQCKAGMDNNPE